MKIVISEKSGKSYQTEIDETRAKLLYGLKIGQTFDGKICGAQGYELKIAGGTDKDGFPMRSDLSGAVRKKIFISNRKGERSRKTFRGNTIAEDIAQVNTIVVKEGDKKLEELFPKKEEKK
ncbi:MAG: 30S ribosomal protein S6e [archaeon]